MTDSNDHPGGPPGTVGPYRVEDCPGPERGLRVGCEAHDTWEEFDPGQRGVAFYCPDCAMEIEVRLHDDLDWRDWGERC